MEKETRIVRKSEIVEHSFYCDSCNEYIGASQEHDDGFYYEHGLFELRFFIDDEWYCLRRCYCNDCRDNFITNMKSILQGIGFKEGYYYD